MDWATAAELPLGSNAVIAVIARLHDRSST
jgi:hypothetical protein